MILFAAIFVPWMVAVAAKHAHAWDLWNWQYIQRAEGDYEDTRPRGLFYYIPYAFGLTTPWLFLLPEALAAPWLRRYAQYRRPLLYAGFWCVVSIAFMSIEPFKKPYYILPAIPALILLMAVVAERLYGMRFQIRSPQLVWALFFIAATATAIGIGIALHQLRQTMPALLIRITPIVVVTAHLLFLAIAAFIRGKGWSAFGLTAGTSIVAFTATWQLCGPVFGNLDKVTALARALDKAGVPADTQILWADKRPDARLSFYFGRQSRYMVTPAEIVSRMVDRTKAKMQLLELAVERAKDLLENSRPVYLIVERSNYDKMMRVRRFTELAHLIDIVHEAGDPERKDWTIISNIKPSLASFNTSKTSP